ncbi:MAG: hypothetical protein HY866_15520 [Chloroflexi bacterium]|nr:hypothetical protein [Chloroflexota bacterium]
MLIGEPVRKLRLATSFTVDLSNIEPCFGEVERTINIFHSIPIPSPTRNIHPVGILSAPMLGNRLPQVIASWFRPEWFELWKELGDIYFGVFYNVIREPRFEFLALMQVLESFHRGKLGGQYLSEKEYKPILQALVNAIPDNVSPEFKESLTKTLNYGYEYKLVTRLAELLDLIGEDLKQILEIDEEYIKWLVRTRNNLTHYGANKKSKKKKSFDSQKLMQAHGRLSHLILALILKEELAIPEEIIQDLLKNRRSVGKLY